MSIDLKTVVDRANAVAETLTGNAAQVRQMVERHDVVIGFWQDPKEEGGVGTYVVKGQRALMDIASEGKAAALRWTAIPCTCAEQAIAL